MKVILPYFYAYNSRYEKRKEDPENKVERDTRIGRKNIFQGSWIKKV